MKRKLWKNSGSADHPNDSYINAETVCELLEQLRRKYPSGPLTLFLDNARYQRCQLVQDRAEVLQMELAYLPPYSPNLNLIERLWNWPRFASSKRDSITIFSSGIFCHIDLCRLLLAAPDGRGRIGGIFAMIW